MACIQRRWTVIRLCETLRCVARQADSQYREWRSTTVLYGHYSLSARCVNGLRAKPYDVGSDRYGKLHLYEIVLTNIIRGAGYPSSSWGKDGIGRYVKAC